MERKTEGIIVDEITARRQSEEALAEMMNVDGSYHNMNTHIVLVEKDGQMVEWMEFIGWKYGLTIEEFEKADIMIMSKDGLEMLPKKYRDRCFVIYLDVDRMVRLDRLNTRNDKNDNVWRRMSTDEKQFDGFTDYDIKIKNEDF